ncbi:DsbA family protein [Plantibacter sp. YIM 135249]|uniref:DsbA family protein n=1 Tax=Plantibacter sp. YIM 135249 TaxID=3423918 RepID=UPI003D33A432
MNSSPSLRRRLISIASRYKWQLVTTGAVLALALVGALFVIAGQQKAPVPPGALGPSGLADGQVLLVEYVDFECEACGALSPYVQAIREDFPDEVTFQTRHYPQPSHGNSMNAALAVEAARGQSKGDEMIEQLFKTQAVWGERGRQSQAGYFRELAQKLQLDLNRYDADLTDPSTRERIDTDIAMGRSLGIQGTPTFFLDGEQVQLHAVEDLRSAVESALQSR